MFSSGLYPFHKKNVDFRFGLFGCSRLTARLPQAAGTIAVLDFLRMRLKPALFKMPLTSGNEPFIAGLIFMTAA